MYCFTNSIFYKNFYGSKFVLISNINIILEEYTGQCFILSNMSILLHHVLYKVSVLILLRSSSAKQQFCTLQNKSDRLAMENYRNAVPIVRTVIVIAKEYEMSAVFLTLHVLYMRLGMSKILVLNKFRSTWRR